MELFDKNGHLRDEALTALICEVPLEPLGRLEISEHLAYCDCCLHRYTTALPDADLPAPSRSCRTTLWPQIRRREVSSLVSRYATAAAAVALALTLLWGGERLSLPAIPEGRPSVSAQLNESMGNILTTLQGLFEDIAHPPIIQKEAYNHET